MKKFLFIFFIILGYQKSIQAATFYSDTIWIKLENGALLRLVGNDFDHKFPKKVEFSKYMKDFLNSWEEIKEKSPAKRVNVFYEKRNTSNLFRITESDPSGKTFLIAPEDSFKFSVPQSNILDFNIHKIQARLYFTETKQLKEGEQSITENLFQQLKKNIEESRSIYPLNRWYVFTPEGELIFVHAERSNYNQNDLVTIGIGTDIQLLKNRWAPGVSGSISIVFCRKFTQKNRYSLLYDGIYDFSSENNTAQNFINHFVGIGYSHNYAKMPGYKSWFGFNFFYLVKNQGSLFEKNTFCIALVKNFNSHLNIQPMLYFDHFFRSTYPSIKMSVQF